uniref:leucine--tRNA ligase n=1 Tax=Timema shepardi TaxID=629360 RepID=A0A7R9AUL3_TIMSH|nr:unnamed protein product [Timema shepardi]
MNTFMCQTNFLKNIAKETTVQTKRLTHKGLSKWNEDLTLSTKHSIENYWKSKLKFPPFDDQKPKYYVLSMFPYPSGRLHMGHVRVYTISDTMARFHQMNGKNVIHPMGWDAFGLPAENAAIERSVEPRKWTNQNIVHMKNQMKQLGCSFDWDREVSTCDVSYYHWTQALFLKLYESGLVYRKEALVNWDPVDQTVLADEQVDENGCSWRSGAKVEKKLLNQWFIRATQFAKSLYDGLSDPLLKNWRDIIKVQKHWIGECDGTTFEFELEGIKSETRVNVWTRNPESVLEATFIAVSPGSVLDKLDLGEIFSENTVFRKLSLSARNPFTQALLPVYVTDRVSYEDGTDTHLGVPRRSESDKLFAELANIPLSSTPGDDVSSVSSTEEAVKEHVCEIARQKNIGGYPVSSKLRDWLISRQRYWGTPIPMIHCTSCGGIQPVPFKDLPVVLPEIECLSSRGQSPLLEATDWLHTKCPKCGGDATRETDTMDTFVDSSWYFLRYLDPHNKEEPFSKEKVSNFMPVDLYIGGKEHAVLHLYYARLMNHFLHQVGLVPHREPFRRLLVQGMVKGRSYRVKGTGRYLTEQQVDLSGKQPVEKDTGQPVITTWEKMSKSKHNGVDPDDMLKDYGIDTTRLLILADVSPTSHRHWTVDTFPGILNWQNRLWLTMRNFLNERSTLSTGVKCLPNSPEFEKDEAWMFDNRNFFVKGVTFQISVTFQLSVAISRMQGLTNSLRRANSLVVAHSLQFERALAAQIILLAPMAPHFASELWSGYVSAPHRLDTSGEILWDKGVLEQAWPQVDSNYEGYELLCKVNGRDMCNFKMTKSHLNQLTHDDAMELALSQTKLQQSTQGCKIINTKFTLRENFEAVLHLATETTDRKIAKGS